VTRQAAGQHSEQLADSGSTFPTLRDLGHQQLEAACVALGDSGLLPRALEVFDLLSEPWSGWSAQHAPHWQSDITDDGSPFELSLAFSGGRPELRILAEHQQQPLSAESGWQAGLELNDRLAFQYGADLSRFDRIRDLFAPLPTIPVRFSMWHAAVVRSAEAAPDLKLYLNPQVVGAEGAARLIERMLVELGLESAWRALSQRVSPRAQFIYVSLDLSPSEQARVKVYTAHPGATAEQIDEQLQGISWNTRAGARAGAAEWIEALAGTRGPLTARPVQTCYAFRGNGAPPEVTTYVPVRTYVEDDAEAIERACKFLPSGEAELLRRVASALADRPLETGRGLLTYVGLRPGRDRPRVTAYLSPQVYSIASPRRPSSAARAPLASVIRDLKPSAPAATPSRPPVDGSMTFKDIQAIVATGQSALAKHPFLVHLERDATYEEVLRIAPRVAFFVMCFQDVLRLVHEKTTDPALKALARTHEAEDKGHDLWYLHDLQHLGVSCGVRDLFSKDNRGIRDIAYTQISDALKVADDRSRLGIVLALEAAGTVFFGRMINCLERLDAADGLLYFARKHQQVEASHEIFESSAQQELDAIVVPESVKAELLEVIDRTFGTMTALAENLEAALRKPASSSEAQGRVA
jgi:DMATS type aromatic prenyltransferase